MSQYSLNTLVALNDRLYPRFRKHNLTLEVIAPAETTTVTHTSTVPTILYTRPASQAQAVESMMGRDLPSRRIECRRHPVLELRVTDTGIALELVISPDAWWDQQNLVGKLTIERHRRDFRKLIGQLGSDYRFGFWQGTHLDEMHLNAQQLGHSAIFDQWMNTFYEGQDWFRVGLWYDLDTVDDTFNGELFRRTQELDTVYQYIAWTSNNDFRSFYRAGDQAYA